MTKRSASKHSEVAIHAAQAREDARAKTEGRKPRLISRMSDITDLPKAKPEDTEDMARLRNAILSAASLLQEIPVGTLLDEETFDFVDADVRTALSALEDIQDQGHIVRD